MTLHPRLQSIVDEAEAARADLLAAVAAVPPAVRERRPREAAWSVAEVLDHLAKVEVGVAHLVAKRVASARERGVGAETSVEPIVLPDRYDFRDRSRAIAAPEQVLPASGVTVDAALAALARSRAALRQGLVAGSGLALDGLHATHPLLGQLNLYQWVLFVARHEARHADQVRECASALAGSRAS